MSQISQAIGAGKHINLSSQYGCRAYMTVATFVMCGIVHRARRFFRADMPTTGRVELYTIESYPGAAITTMTESGWYDSTASEDWLGYAVDGSRAARHAMAALDAVGSMVISDAAERAALVELS